MGTRANVEVHSSPFTTKALYVGQLFFDFKRWQVIDTPGLLDRPIEERNTIEMQTITAVAHLKACLLYVIYISTESEHAVEDQVSLLKAIQPILNEKPLIVIYNKIDLVSPELKKKKYLVKEGCTRLQIKITIPSASLISY